MGVLMGAFDVLAVAVLVATGVGAVRLAVWLCEAAVTAAGNVRRGHNQAEGER
jgi:hypothetical protein